MLKSSKFLITTAAVALVACTTVGDDAAASSAGEASAEKRKKSKNEVRSISAKDKASGAKAHPQLLQQFGGEYDGPQKAYVVRIGQDIAVQSGLGDARTDFTVTLLNSPVNNAFAIPGGYVYLTRQLMALMNDEAEMAGVLGHEVGHVAARHGKKRQSAARRNSILGVLGQIGAAVLLGDTGLGRLGQQVFGTGSQLLTLRYSRKQEYEADDLGIQYLASANYDPTAVGTMLESLAAQTAIDAKASGRDARNIPEWASTHPNPVERVKRAAKKGREFNAPNGRRNRAVFLQNLDGILYGDDPKQGIVDGQNFVHPDLRFKFAVPAGFNMQNGSAAVSISGSGGRAQFSGGSYAGNMDSYIDAAFIKLSGKNPKIKYGSITRRTVNGLPAAFATGQVRNRDGTADITVFAYEFSKSQAFHFTTIVPAGQSGTFSSMYNSVRRISAREAAAVKPRKVDVVTIKRGDTIGKLAGRMAYSELKTERFLVLNRMKSNDVLRAGQKVKIITY